MSELEPPFKLTPQQWFYARWGMKLLLPTFFLLLLSPWFAITYLLYWVGYFLWYAVKWAFRSDRVERDRRRFEDSFKSVLGDLKGFEAEVGKGLKGALGKVKPKKKRGGQFLDVYTGKPMRCIICLRPTNSGGRFCDDHDEDG